MKIKITEKARKMYGENCPFSTDKCESLSELDYKIQRCIDLGRITNIYENMYWVQYYSLEFHILNNELVNIVRNEEYFNPVKESIKLKHCNKHYKVLV